MKPFYFIIPLLMAILFSISLTTHAQSTPWMQLKRSGIPKVAMGLNTTNEFYISRQDSGAILLNGDKIIVGTENPADTSFKLFVYQGIRTRKVKVDLDTWADFVFEPSYCIYRCK